jgi:hypothetical protein
MKIPGLSFSIQRAVGISGVKQTIARKINVPTTKHGRMRKLGSVTTDLLSGRDCVKSAGDIVKLTVVNALMDHVPLPKTLKLF